MKFLLLFTYCTAAIASLVATASNDNAVQVRDPTADSATDGGSLARLLSRDSSDAYQEAARVAGGSLSSNTYYYFMNCAIAPDWYQPTTSLGQWAMSEHGCNHVGLVVGKTARILKKFKATYIHIRLLSDGFCQASHDYTPYENQKLVYGGRTSSSKANVDRLVAKGDEWLEGSGTVLTEQYNCVAHYRYLESLL
ncbi:hypothetical protein BDP81DRAFT_362589 [Colletotrichum phormii]|uniref:Ecp2 effector protein domain-containing protein n=1 Tax=Colletotrichum phormii TaxID=359342 RepID=A0AAJ0E779_9PEZI|nr:uncharacterized protein BDP81DRAFT_362589 [Colletotrichum phormii]KAK1621434.1 hypothetical protein BDP81DRAFT_362589 [Colletotrichum phormii]